MIAGASWIWWLGFHAVVAALLVADSLLPGRRLEARRTQTVAWLWTAFLVAVATGFAFWIAITRGHQTALEFVAGYSIEASLSVDISSSSWSSSRVSAYRRAVSTPPCSGVWPERWFCARSSLPRASTLFRRFEWITWIFGLILL